MLTYLFWLNFFRSSFLAPLFSFIHSASCLIHLCWFISSVFLSHLLVHLFLLSCSDSRPSLTRFSPHTFWQSFSGSFLLADIFPSFLHYLFSLCFSLPSFLSPFLCFTFSQLVLSLMFSGSYVYANLWVHLFWLISLTHLFSHVIFDLFWLSSLMPHLFSASHFLNHYFNLVFLTSFVSHLAAFTFCASFFLDFFLLLPFLFHLF